MELECAVAELDGQAGDIEARIAAARSRVAQIEIQILQIGTERSEEAEAQAREVQAQENAAWEELAALRRRLDRMPEWAPAWARDWLAPGGKGDRRATGAAPAVPPAHAQDLELAPGMPVEVHTRTGERSPLSDLAKPLTDYFSRSLRED